jgi:hypothetical protein
LWFDIGNIEEVKKSFDRASSSHDLNTVISSTHDIELALNWPAIYVIGYPTVGGKQNHVYCCHDLRKWEFVER